MMDYFKRLASGQPFRKRDESGPQYGSVIERTLAWMVDITMVYTLGSGLLTWLTGFVYGVHGAEAVFAAKRGVVNDLATHAGQAVQTLQPMELFGAESFRQFLMENLVGYVLVGLVVVSLQVFWGATPGKWLLGLKVVRRRSFEPLTPLRYGLRYIAYLVAVAPLMLGIIWADFNREKRGWHDMLVDTVVIHTRPRGWYWAQVKQAARWLKRKILPPKTGE